MTASADAAAKAALTRRRLLPRLGAMGSAGLMAAALASCGAGSQSSTSGAAPAAKVKPGTVVQWMLQSQAGPNLEADTKTAALFEQAYADKGLKVDRQQSLAGKDYLDKVTALFASGTPPHVIWLLPTDVAPYQAKKLLLDLTTLAKRDKFDFADFFPAAWDQFRYTSDGKAGTGEGDLYGSPKDIPSRALAYNVDAFAEVGVKPPPANWSDAGWNWQSFVDAATKLTRRDGGGPNGISRWGWAGNEAYQEWIPWVFNNGGEILSPDGKESRFDHPKTVDAFQFLADLERKQNVEPTPQQRQSEAPAEQLFFTGKLGMIHFGPANIGRWRTGIQGFAWDVAVWPRGSGPATAVASSSGWMTPLATKDPDEAWLFHQHLASAAVQRSNAEAGYGVPMRRSIMQQVFAAQSPPPKNVRVFEENAKIVRVVTPIKQWADMTAIFDQQLPALWRGEATAKDVCAQIKRLADALLKSG